jgi:hypothetical protein
MVILNVLYKGMLQLLSKMVILNGSCKLYIYIRGTDIHPKPIHETISLVSKLYLPLLNLKNLNKFLNYIHLFIFIF